MRFNTLKVVEIGGKLYHPNQLLSTLDGEEFLVCRQMIKVTRPLVNPVTGDITGQTYKWDWVRYADRVLISATDFERADNVNPDEIAILD